MLDKSFSEHVSMECGLISEVAVLMRLFRLKLTRTGLGTTGLISKVHLLMGWPDPEVLLYMFHHNKSTRAMLGPAVLTTSLAQTDKTKTDTSM